VKNGGYIFPDDVVPCNSPEEVAARVCGENFGIECLGFKVSRETMIAHLVRNLLTVEGFMSCVERKP
jgi:hypothetical protein